MKKILVPLFTTLALMFSLPGVASVAVDVGPPAATTAPAFDVTETLLVVSDFSQVQPGFRIDADNQKTAPLKILLMPTDPGVLFSADIADGFGPSGNVNGENHVSVLAAPFEVGWQA